MASDSHSDSHNDSDAKGASADDSATEAASERQRALALLEATHQFPVEYHLSVITVHAEETFAELRAAVEAGLANPLPADAYQRIPSSGGKYASHRFRVRCTAAEDVLDLYARIRSVQGVKQVL